ncbi:hypothetical protein ABZX75_04700 [Streptomyces sp. NPDC003038]|uniref:hypothetical protein n=1 Tax=unclassified Streptomyces TaxID=2593676 RepID=UPI0033BDA751
MRIRAAVTTATFVATLVLGGAAAAVAHGTDDDQPNGGSVHYGACEMSAGVVGGNPLYNAGCVGGAIDWR